MKEDEKVIVPLTTDEINEIYEEAQKSRKMPIWQYNFDGKIIKLEGFTSIDAWCE